MASNPENVRLNVLTKLQEALDIEDILAEQILTLMHRFADRFTDRRVEINNLMVLHDHPLIDYGKLQGRFISLQVKITWASRFLKFSCKETDRFSLGYRNFFFCHKVFGVTVLNFKGDKVLQEVSNSRFWFKEETGLLDFLAFRFVNDKVAAGRYRQVKVIEFFDCLGQGQGVEVLRESLHRVSNDDTAVAQRRLEDKQPEEKKSTNCLVKEQEKIHHRADVGAIIMKTKVPGQEGAKGNTIERYREDSNKAAFAVKKIYAYESLTFNDTVACEVISK
nr:hypothetical protein [Tanacetum cinerariifolium]